MMQLFTLLLLAVSQEAFAAPVTSFEKRQSTVPSYVIEYAPLVWLQSTEKYMPGNIASQLTYTHPEINFTDVSGAPNPLTLNNLNELNNLGGSSIYLSSNDDFTTYPAWLDGVKPDSSGKTEGATSCAIITVNRGNGSVDVFYMYFYNFNLGNKVFGQYAGNHVGDWEHNMIRFQDGVPQAMWFSQHSDGQAFTYNAVEKQGVRPLSYSALGDHANYPKAGEFDHTIPGLVLPFGVFLKDYTNQGTLWDPTLNSYIYEYDPSSNVFTAYDGTSPVNWLYFTGQWGDEQLPSSDPRQHNIFGLTVSDEWTSGPTGPIDKSLNRTDVCPDGESVPCVILPVLVAK